MHGPRSHACSKQVEPKFFFLFASVLAMACSWSIGFPRFQPAPLRFTCHVGVLSGSGMDYLSYLRYMLHCPFYNASSKSPEYQSHGYRNAVGRHFRGLSIPTRRVRVTEPSNTNRTENRTSGSPVRFAQMRTHR